MKQGFVNYNWTTLSNDLPESPDDIRLEGTADIRVTQLAVNEILPAALFQMEFKEGVNVWDKTHDPPLFYKYKKEMPAEEWANIVQNAERQKTEDAAAKKLKDSLVGQAAPTFPEESMWLNSEPLAWEGLKGKVVVLDFFSEWCGPCQNDFPLAAAIHEKREENGVVIIGIHTAESKVAAIEKLLSDFKIEYPVCVDVKGADKTTWGRLYDAYHVNFIPYAVVVDRGGIVRGNGTLGTVLGIARKMVADEKRGK